MATASSLTLTQKLYVAYYGRPADPFGLEAWATMIDKNGGAVSVDIVNQFGSSAEANSLFGGKTTAQKVNAIYLQCFGREAETDGLRAWVQAIDSGRVTQAGAMLEILNGASGSDATAVANKLSIASAFTSALVASHVETQGFMHHEERLAAPHCVIPAQAGILVCPPRTAV